MRRLRVLFKRRQTSKPSMLGIITSSRMTSGGRSAICCKRLHAVLGLGNFIAARFQRVAQQSAVLFFVVHDQHESARSALSRRTRV